MPIGIRVIKWQTYCGLNVLSVPNQNSVKLRQKKQRIYTEVIKTIN